MIKITLEVNEFSREILVNPDETLLYTLRERLHLTGTKKGCDQASCGSCTVLLDGEPVLSCITPTVRCAGRKIITIENIAGNGILHPVQDQLVKKGGLQCGFCTPGIVITAVDFLEKNKNPKTSEIKEALSGNLCRCTGYKKIIEAVKAAAEDMNK